MLAERQRMAREMHDTVAQGLTGIIAQMQAAEQRHEVPEPWRSPFEAVKQLARESLTETRRSVDALRPEASETARLAGALSDVVERWPTLHGLPVQLTTTGTPRPPAPEADFALLRTAQEALANIARHANAARAGVTLSYPGARGGAGRARSHLLNIYAKLGVSDRAAAVAEAFHRGLPVPGSP